MTTTARLRPTTPAAESPKEVPAREPEPSIGRIVHFVLPVRDSNGVYYHRPALVTRVEPKAYTGEEVVILQYLCDLTVFPDADDMHYTGAKMPATLVVAERNVEYDQSGLTPKSWHWPERI